MDSQGDSIIVCEHYKLSLAHSPVMSPTSLIDNIIPINDRLRIAKNTSLYNTEFIECENHE